MNKQINCNTIGQGRPLIFVTGFGNEHEIYKKNLKHLKDEFRLFILDFTRPFPNKNISIETFADALNQFINKNKIKNPTLIGHSLGGAICLAYSLSYKNFHKIILLNPVGLTPVDFKKIIKFLILDKKELLTLPGITSNIKALSSYLLHLIWSTKKLKIIKNFQFEKNSLLANKNIKIIFTSNDHLFPLEEIKKLPQKFNIKIIDGCHNWPLIKPKKLKQIILEICQNPKNKL